MSSAPVLEASSLRKAYGKVLAVSDVSFSVGASEIVGLLGPNGAGKSTTVAMIAGLLKPDAGEVRIAGARLAGDTDPAKASIGLVPQDLALYEELSAIENLRFFGALQGLGGAALRDAIDTQLGFVGLADRARDRVSTFSGGMKRRLNLAAGLLHDPRLLLLDEPTVGVDPQSRNAIFDNLEALRGRGKSLVYTTHYMEEAERLCDRIVIVDHGRVVASDTVRGLAALIPKTRRLRIDLAEAPTPTLLREARLLPGVEAVEAAGTLLTLTVTDMARGAPAVLTWLADQAVAVEHLESERSGLEAVFLSLTGRSLRD